MKTMLSNDAVCSGCETWIDESRDSEFRVYEQDGGNGQIRAKVNESELLRDSQ